MPGAGAKRSFHIERTEYPDTQRQVQKKFSVVSTECVIGDEAGEVMHSHCEQVEQRRLRKEARKPPRKSP